MSDFKAQQRVRLNNGTSDFGFAVTAPVFVTLSDGTDSVMDTANDAVRVSIVAGSTAGTEFAEDSVAASGDLGPLVLVVRKDVIGSNVDADGDYATLLQDANGRLYVQIHDGGNSITVDAVDLDIRDLTHVSDSVKVGDGTDFIAINADGSINITDNGGSLTVDGTVAATQSGTWTVELGATTLAALESITVTATDFDIRDLTLAQDAVRISGNATANSQTNPIFVQVVDTAISGNEVQDYDTSAAIASDATDNHDYTVVGTTFLLTSIIFAASGAMKIELQVGPVASLVTKAVAFTSPSSPTGQLFFDPPIEVPSTSTGTIRIIRRNDDNQSQDVYSTIIGYDV